MAKITIEGDPEEIEKILRRLGRQTLTDSRQEANPEEGSEDRQINAEEGDQQPLSSEEVSQLFSQITPEARKILQEIAKHPNGYPFADLQEAMHLDGTAIAGRLSSVGHKMRRFRGKAVPVTRDYSQRLYRMEPQVAEAIRNLGES